MMIGQYYVIAGKSLETIGSLFLAWVGFKIAYLEWHIGRRLCAQGINDAEIEDIRSILHKAMEKSRKRFGPTEALLVGIGTLLIAFGSLVYTFGLWQELHPH